MKQMSINRRDEIVEFAKLYKVDVRELLLEDYAEVGMEQVRCNLQSD